MHRYRKIDCSPTENLFSNSSGTQAITMQATGVILRRIIPLRQLSCDNLQLMDSGFGIATDQPANQQAQKWSHILRINTTTYTTESVFHVDKISTLCLLIIRTLWISFHDPSSENLIWVVLEIVSLLFIPKSSNRNTTSVWYLCIRSWFEPWCCRF